MGKYEIEIIAIFKTLLAMENDGVITHEQFLHYAKISEDEYMNLALTLYYDIHDEGLELMSAIDACFTAWYKTEAGRAAWSASCCDYNIGDMLCGDAPDRDFTRQYGFEFLEDTGEDIIEMSYDRVLGCGPKKTKIKC